MNDIIVYEVFLQFPAFIFSRFRFYISIQNARLPVSLNKIHGQNEWEPIDRLPWHASHGLSRRCERDSALKRASLKLLFGHHQNVKE